MLNIAVSLLAIAATALQVLDVLSTYHMLARGGHEENPIDLLPDFPPVIG